ncbi:MAG: TIGR03032 family protein [Planctomycetes bacterium]|nr:TIGR03032 family protein [Planctomycetota bacterium]
MPETPQQKQIKCRVDDSFAAWLSAAGGSIAVTTYQAGKVALVGWNGKQVSIVMRDFPRPMGLAVHGQQLAMATLNELTLFANSSLLAPEFLEPARYDGLYLPRMSYFTGGLNLHDMAFGDDGLWLVNTRFSCLVQLDGVYSFVPRWQPPFITLLAPEDRCHLNGLAMVGGKPRYVTALGRADTPRGWHPNRTTGGLLMDVNQPEPIVSDLCMPHSPRWHDGKLWVLNSAQGELCLVDLATGKRTVVCAMPGYLRGLCFVGPYALIGMSKVREKYLFAGLPLQSRFPKLTCGVAAVDLRSGRPVGLFEFTEACEELYDVQFLPGVLRPMILDPGKPSCHDAITTPEFSYWMSPKPGARDFPPAQPPGPNAPPLPQPSTM